MVAVRNGRKRCARVLLEAGCDVHLSDSVSWNYGFHVTYVAYDTIYDTLYLRDLRARKSWLLVLASLFYCLEPLEK